MCRCSSISIICIMPLNPTLIKPYERGIIMFPVLQIVTLRHREGKKFTQDQLKQSNYSRVLSLTTIL